MNCASQAHRLLLAICAIAAAAGRGAPSQAQAAPVTFASDVAPILYDACVECHHPGGSAPFSLLTYDDARHRALRIADAASRRYMPPWKAERGYGGPFVGQRVLTERELQTLRRWADDGAMEGDPRDLPPMPVLAAGWELGQPDIVLRLSKPYQLQADGSDVFRVFVIPVPVDEVRFVRGLEFHPGNPKVVHHANIRIDETAASREMDDADPLPGYDDIILRSAHYPDGHFLGWTPGQVRPLLPERLAWRLAPHTDLVVEIHMQPDGAREVVDPEIGLFFGTEAPGRPPFMLRLGNQRIDIPAGDPAYTITDSYTLPVDVEIEALQPHAHYRAREIRGTATLPDGTTRWLIYIKDWDFRWQHVYRLAQPYWLPRGTTLSMRYTYDNSAANPRNPQLPPQRVTWGQRSKDEMGDLWIQVLTRSDLDRDTLVESFTPKVLAEDAYGEEAEIARHPDNPYLHDDAGLLYLDLGQTDLAIRHFAASARLQPGSARAHFNLGTALLTGNRLDEAMREFREAIRIEPAYAVAHNNLGNALFALGRTDESIAEFSAALAADPSNLETRVSLAGALRTSGNFAGAIDEYRRVVQLDGDSAPAVANLAWLLATAPDADLRQPDQAVAFAHRAVEITGGRDPAAFDVLAAAYAAAGAFDEAVGAADVALRLLTAGSTADAIRARRALYLQHRAYVLAGPR